MPGYQDPLLPQPGHSNPPTTSYVVLPFICDLRPPTFASPSTDYLAVCDGFSTPRDRPQLLGSVIAGATLISSKSYLHNHSFVSPNSTFVGFVFDRGHSSTASEIIPLQSTTRVTPVLLSHVMKYSLPPQSPHQTNCLV